MHNMREQFFAKSFEEDFILKALKGKKKANFQSIENVLSTKTLRLNTRSFGREPRLACSFLHRRYLKTYSPHGLIFRTSQKPDFVYPFNLVLLSDAKKIMVQYYRIKENLHLYYNHRMIPGFEKFVFQDVKSLLNQFPTLHKVWTDINKFRKDKGYHILPRQKHRLIEYNEAIFCKPVRIEPVAIFGYSKLAREIAKKHNLPRFDSAQKFYESLKA